MVQFRNVAFFALLLACALAQHSGGHHDPTETTTFTS
eukprot:gene3725-2218_t